MRLANLQAFIAVVDEGNFTRAADKLYVAQSTVSRLVADLEDELGCQLIRRDKHKMEITQAGTLIYGHARRMVSYWERMKSEASLFSEHSKSSLRIGYTFPDMLSYVSRALNSKDFPHKKLELNLRYAEGRELIGMIRENRLDCAIMHRPSLGDAEDMGVFLIQNSMMDVMVPSGHSLSGKKKIRLSDLRGETEVRCERETEYYHVIDTAFRMLNIPPLPHITGHEPEDCRPLVQYNQYVAFSPSIYSAWNGCVSLEITDWPIDFNLVFVYNANHLAPAVESLYYAIKSSITE
ncbi:MAG: LysR family transcriptional regulator [Eubacteriales bacterium]|nr:LysR family transcriptional regulator [Eubacteriales bacterium]